MSDKNINQLVEKIGNLTLIEVSDLVKKMMEEFGISDMPVAMAPAAGGGATAAAAEEKSEFKVTLKSSGEKKLDTIKIVRKVTSWGLMEAKKAVEDAPTILVEAMPKDDANKLKADLEAVGATVELS